MRGCMNEPKENSRVYWERRYLLDQDGLLLRVRPRLLRQLPLLIHAHLVVDLGKFPLLVLLREAVSRVEVEGGSDGEGELELAC